MDLHGAWRIRGPWNVRELNCTDGQSGRRPSSPKSQDRWTVEFVLALWPRSPLISWDHMVSDQTEQRLWSHPVAYAFLSKSPPHGNCHPARSTPCHHPPSRERHPHVRMEKQTQHSKQLLKHFPAMWSINTGNGSWLDCREHLFASQGARALCVS